MVGNVKEDSPKMAFAAVKKVLNDDCLESLNTKNLGELCNSLKLKASGTKSESLQRLLPFKDDPALLDNRVKNISAKYSFTTAETGDSTTNSWMEMQYFPLSQDFKRRYQDISV